MASQPVNRFKSAEEAREHIGAFLHRDPAGELDVLLRSENDTIIHTDAFSSVNFLAGSYGTKADGPSTATPSSPPSHTFSKKSGPRTNPTEYTRSKKGKSIDKHPDTSSVGAARGSSTDESSGTTSGSEVDRKGAINLKDTGAGFGVAEANNRPRTRRNPKASISYGRGYEHRRVDPTRHDAKVTLQRQLPNYATSPSPSPPSSPKQDLEADVQWVSSSSTNTTVFSTQTKVISTIFFSLLLAVLGGLLFALVHYGEDASQVVSIALVIILVASVIALSIAVIVTHGEDPRAARCVFTVGMFLISVTASLAAFSFDRPPVECYLVMLAVLSFAILMGRELDAILA